MDLRHMTPVAIAEELGKRLKQARLNVNVTQAEVASRTGLSRRTVLNAEKGRVQMEHFIAIVSSLDMVEQLNLFMPEQEISPLQLAKLKGRERQRASKPKNEKAHMKKETPSW